MSSLQQIEKAFLHSSQLRHGHVMFSLGLDRDDILDDIPFRYAVFPSVANQIWAKEHEYRQCVFRSRLLLQARIMCTSLHRTMVDGEFGLTCPQVDRFIVMHIETNILCS